MASESPAIPPPATEAASPDQTAYSDLKRLIPSLAQELDQLRTALREHNLWLQRYGHSSIPEPDPIPPTHLNAPPDLPDLPAYSASDLPPYTGGTPISTRDEVQQRRDQITEWLKEGEDVLREYSARFAQLGEQLGMQFEDVLGTWVESSTDNALPDYERVEEREELMVGGVGEVPPPYTGKGPAGEPPSLGGPGGSGGSNI